MKNDKIKKYPLTYNESYPKDYIGSFEELWYMIFEKDLEPVNHNL